LLTYELKCPEKCEGGLGRAVAPALETFKLRLDRALSNLI